MTPCSTRRSTLEQVVQEYWLWNFYFVKRPILLGGSITNFPPVGTVETLLQWKSSHGKFLNHCSFPDRVAHSEPPTKKMKIISLLLLSSLKISSASVVTDRFKSLTDILYECPLGCDKNELTIGHSDKILSNVDCDLNSARWDFQITVSVSSFQFVHYI